MVYTVTFNPAIDYYVSVDSLKEGSTNRSLAEEIRFGGKGINVSVILSRLGVETVALGFVAGFTGVELERQLSKLSVKTDFIHLSGGNTRINVKLKDAKNKTETEINTSGPAIKQEELSKFFEKIKYLKNEDILVLSGSVPNCLQGDIYKEIAKAVKAKGARLVVDAAGELLTKTLKYKPFLIKPNIHELEEICGQNLSSKPQVVDAGRSLKAMGAVNVLISMGKNGAILIDENNIVHEANAVGGEAVNTVGAGDSMVAGFIAGSSKGYDFALKLGLAAGGATASQLNLATKEQIYNLLG